MSTSKNVRRIYASAWVSFAAVQALPMVASAQIEEIVVTTRRREESLKDVPIAVSAISSEQIQRGGLTDLKDIVANQPSVQFDQSFGPSDNRITIRGLSNTRGRSNVAFLVDGIDTTTENLIAAGSGLLANRRLLTDVERIEIVKGPQSALFGRAAFAGAFNYVTKEPTDEFDGRVSFDVGDYGKRSIDAAFGGPVTDTFGIRITGVKYNEDGYYTNSILGTDVGGVHGYGGALTAVWKPADPVKVKGRLEYSEESYDPRAVVNLKGDTPYFIPESGKQIARPIITGNPQTQRAGSTATNLYNFGTYCPKFGFDPSNPQGDPGFCLPGVITGSKGLKVTQSEDENTGQAYPGTDTETFRASLVATFDLGYGLLSSYTGWTDFNGREGYDQDYQASTAPDVNGNVGRSYSTTDPRGGRIDTLLGNNEANTTTRTDQFSQEFRYETQWDGPVQITGGALFWQDHRVLEDRNNITFCAPYGRINAAPLEDENGNNVQRDISAAPGLQLGNVLDPTTGDLAFVSAICDGASDTATSWQEYRRLVPDPQFSSTWEATTRHLSFYARVDWKMSDDLTFSLEDRFLDEEFNLTKPASSSCTETAFPQGASPAGTWDTTPTIDSFFDPANPNRVYCDAERIVYNINPGLILDPTTGGLTFRYLEGSTYSSYNTPKVTLAWSANDDTNLFFSYGYGQKPGGINQLAGGGGSEPPGLEEERFDPEKLKAWELGIKTGFETAGFWNVNASIFLNDYTDKQVGIQVVSADGISQPRIINIGGSRVWGFEFETLWQPAFMEGLTLTLAGTILDAKITDWKDDTRNLVKVAVYGDCPLIYKLGDQESTDPLDIAIIDSDGDGDIDSVDAQPSAFCRLDYSGNDLERTPEQSYAASMAIQRPFMDTPFEYLFELSGNWQDERWLEPENNSKLADYARLNMRLGLTSDNWEVIAYVDNVLDDDRFLTAGSGPDFGEQVTELGFTAGFGTTHYFGTLPDPRVFGLRGTFRFGAGR